MIRAEGDGPMIRHPIRLTVAETVVRVKSVRHLPGIDRPAFEFEFHSVVTTLDSAGRIQGVTTTKPELKPFHQNRL